MSWIRNATSHISRGCNNLIRITWGCNNVCRITCGVIRDYYMTFSMSALVSARDSHIKPDSEAGGLMWVEGWYQGRYGIFHVIIYLSQILHLLFSSIDFYIAEKIFELINCENKSLRELLLSGFKKISSNVDLYNGVRPFSH